MPLESIALVLTEAFADVVVHSYVGTTTAGLRVQVDGEDDGVRLTLGDDGRGLVPRVGSSGPGLGLPIMATLTRHVRAATKHSPATHVCAMPNPIPAEDAPARG